MRASVLGSAALAVLVTASAAIFAQTPEEAKRLRQGVQDLGDRIADQPPLVHDWLQNSEIFRATRDEFRGEWANDFIVRKSIQELDKDIKKEDIPKVQNLMTYLEERSYIQLAFIKSSEDKTTCYISNRFDLAPSFVKSLAEAAYIGKDKEQSARVASINSTISISGAILAVLSFSMSAWSTVLSIRSKKSSTPMESEVKAAGRRKPRRANT
jgi:hypothetical protein